MTNTVVKSTQASPISQIFDLFKNGFSNKSAKSGHDQEIAAVWGSLQSNYSKLHLALDDLKAEEGDIIQFEHLAKTLNLPENIIQNYFDTICFTCIDERAQKNMHNALSIGVPGNFCLEKGACPLFAKRIVIDCIAHKVAKIKLMPHAKCGAATLAVKAEFEALGWETDHIPDILIDKKSIDYAERMATIIEDQANRMDYQLDVEVEFITASEIEPKTFHNAIGSIVNVTASDSLDLTRPHLDPKIFNENVDPMFNIAGFGTDETIVDRISLSVDIAFGGHGMSTAVFSKSNPYLILMVADSKDAVSRAKDQILPLLKAKITQKYENQIVESYILDISNFK